MNGDQMEYSQFTRGCKGNRLTPVNPELKATQSFYTDKCDFDALLQVHSSKIMGRSNI
jgi:hypothetical protein